MKLLGIDFVPLNTPLKAHLEALSAAFVLFITFGMFPVGIGFTVYVLFASPYWMYFCLYLFYICVFDRDVSELGGRPNDWVRSWTVFKYAYNYFPIKVATAPGVKLDSGKNYMACAFPHGVMPMGNILLIFRDACKEWKTHFPNHTLIGITLRGNFFIPLYREILLAIGWVSATPRSINYILSRPQGGNMLGIMVGGAAESMQTQPGQYQLVLKNRKGFVKLALRNGTPLLPVFAFGQNSTFKQIVFSETSIGRRMQNLFKRFTGAVPSVFYGRGLFQYTFGLIPLQKPITIVVGEPIDVTLIAQPTQEDIDTLHKKFIDRLTELFEKYKYQFEENPESSKLIVS